MKKYVLSILCIIITVSVFVTGCSKETTQSEKSEVTYAYKLN